MGTPCWLRMAPTGGTIANCTITDNTLLAGRGAGGVQIGHSIAGALTQNTVLWGNSSPDGVQAAVWTDVSTFSYCCIPHDVSDTVNRIGQPPQFSNPLIGDYRPIPGSSCIDAGTNRAWMAGAADPDGLPRIVNGAVDIGAYESPSPAITSVTSSDLGDGLIITWASFSGARYAVYGSTNLIDGYNILLQDHIDAQPPLNTFTDTVSGAEIRGYTVEYVP